jgi:hypothetical protein
MSAREIRKMADKIVEAFRPVDHPRKTHRIVAEGPRGPTQQFRQPTLLPEDWAVVIEGLELLASQGNQRAAAIIQNFRRKSGLSGPAPGSIEDRVIKVLRSARFRIDKVTDPEEMYAWTMQPADHAVFGISAERSVRGRDGIFCRGGRVFRQEKGQGADLHRQLFLRQGGRHRRAHSQ